MSDRELATVRSGAGIARRPELATLELTGPDRVRFLNGMVTNDVARLEAGRGMSAVKVNAKGRVEALVRVRADREALFIDARQPGASKLAETLERHLIMDDVVLRDASADREVLTVLGPGARAILDASGLAPIPSDLAEHAHFERSGARIVRDSTLGPLGYELHLPPRDAEEWLSKLVAHGAVLLDLGDLEVLRIESGRPLEGRELTDDVLPMEADLFSAISFTKGCYVGQEVIARGTNLGEMNWSLIGLRFDGPAEAGLLLFASGTEKSVGEVTSAIRSPLAGWIGLGYVRKPHHAPETRLEARSESGSSIAIVASRPLVAPSGE